MKCFAFPVFYLNMKLLYSSLFDWNVIGIAIYNVFFYFCFFSIYTLRNDGNSAPPINVSRQMTEYMKSSAVGPCIPSQSVTVSSVMNIIQYPSNCITLPKLILKSKGLLLEKHSFPSSDDKTILTLIFV